MTPPVGCLVCTNLEAAGRDPQRLQAGTAGASLYLLVQHHIDAHGATGAGQDGCGTCARWRTPQGIHPHIASRWLRSHLVMHALGIVETQAGLRFADRLGAT